HHSGAKPFDQRPIAGKLNSVAQALFRVEQNGFAAKISAVPEWPGKAALGQLPAAPAPFIFLPAALPVARAQPKKRAGSVPGGIIRLMDQRSLEGRQGSIELAPRVENDAQCVVSIGRVRRKLHCPAACGYRFIDASELLERETKLPVTIGGSGLNFQD